MTNIGNHRLKIITFIGSLLLLTTAGFSRNSHKSDLGKQQQIHRIYDQYASEFPNVPSINVEEFQQLKKLQDTIIVDIRTLEEQEVSMIPNAIAQQEFERNIDRYHQQQIVVYCTIGYRSGKYAQKLLAQGFNVVNLEGSLLAWSHVDGELVNSQGKTKQIHVFSDRWQLTAENYQPVW